MLVYEFQTRIRLKKDIPYDTVSNAVMYLIDHVLGKEEEYLKFHQSKEYKGYVWDHPYPLEKDKIYRKNKVYTVRIRTIRPDLAEYFSAQLPFSESKELLCVGGSLKLIPKKPIERIFSLTPNVIKDDFGYWRGNMSPIEYEERMKVNLYKKYRYFTGKQPDEEQSLYTLIKFHNEKPVKVPYKNVSLLGDKVTLEIAGNRQAQELAYFALGVGLCENNARGCGFVGYKYA